MQAFTVVLPSALGMPLSTKLGLFEMLVTGVAGGGGEGAFALQAYLFQPAAVPAP